MSESENKVFFSKINDPNTCSSLEEMSAQDVADLINKLQNENNLLKRKLEKAIEQRDIYIDLVCALNPKYAFNNMIDFCNHKIDTMK